MDLLADIRGRLNNCISSSCNKSGCKLSLESIKSNAIVIIDTDRCRDSFTANDPLCDYLLFYRAGSDIAAVVMELKGGRIDAERSVAQISNGAKEVDKIISSVSVYNFIPIILFGRRAHTADVRLIQNKRIQFRGRGYRIIMERCGTSLKTIIKKYPPLSD